MVMSRRERGILGALKSKEICAKQKEERIANYNLAPKCCAKCNKSITYAKRVNIFCSQSCSTTYNNLKRNSSNPEQFTATKKVILKVKKQFYCVTCNKILKTKHNKYCSIQCQQDLFFKQKLDNWLSGTVTRFENRWLRKALIFINGNKCSVCKIETWQNKPIVFEVEHIDGNSENNNKENVCLICPNCHSQTDTYKGKNKGKGRHFRMQRYREGKSY
jgi:hypothetical protein